MESPSPQPSIPQGEEVTTEPQRRALEEMSLALTAKLHAMVAEQEARIRDFAAQHQAHSPLPWQQELQTGQTLETQQESPVLPQAYQQVQQADTPQQTGLVGRTHPSITNGPKLPSSPSPRQKTAQPPSARQPFPSKKENESTIGAGMMGFFVFLLAIFILRACN